MHSERLVCFLLGIWLAGGLFMAWVATENFRGAERLLHEGSLSARLDFKMLDDPHTGGPGAARLLLRYQASEQNRFYFESWEVAQIGLGTLLFFIVLFGVREDRFALGIVLLMLALVALQRFLMTPAITALGRSLDFVPAAASVEERARFWRWHNFYVAAEVVKWLAALWIAGKLIIGRRRLSALNAR